MVYKLKENGKCWQGYNGKRDCPFWIPFGFCACKDEDVLYCNIFKIISTNSPMVQYLEEFLRKLWEAK